MLLYYCVPCLALQACILRHFPRQTAVGLLYGFGLRWNYADRHGVCSRDSRAQGIRAHTHAKTDTCTCIRHTCIYMHVYTRIHMHKHACANIYVKLATSLDQISTCTCLCVCVYVCVCVCVLVLCLFVPEHISETTINSSHAANNRRALFPPPICLGLRPVNRLSSDKLGDVVSATHGF